MMAKMCRYELCCTHVHNIVRMHGGRRAAPPAISEMVEILSRPEVACRSQDLIRDLQRRPLL